MEHTQEENSDNTEDYRDPIDIMSLPTYKHLVNADNALCRAHMEIEALREHLRLAFVAQTEIQEMYGDLWWEHAQLRGGLLDIIDTTARQALRASIETQTTTTKGL